LLVQAIGVRREAVTWVADVKRMICATIVVGTAHQKIAKWLSTVLKDLNPRIAGEKICQGKVLSHAAVSVAVGLNPCLRCYSIRVDCRTAKRGKLAGARQSG
jgi:hypothetical protein